MIYHLLSIGNKRLLSLAKLSSLKGRASRWQPVPASAYRDPTVKTPCLLPAHGPSKDNIGVLPLRIVSALYYWRWCVPCTVLAVQHQRPQSNQTHVPSSGKMTRNKHHLQPCKPQPIMSLEHYKESTGKGICRPIALLVISPRMPGGTTSGLLPVCVI